MLVKMQGENNIEIKLDNMYFNCHSVFRRYRMKKLSLLLFTIPLFLISCSNSKNLKEQRESEFAIRIQQLDREGYFDYLKFNARSINNDEEYESITRFISEPKEVIEELRLEEHGAEKVDLIEKLFFKTTVDDLSETFLALDENLSEKFNEALKDISCETNNTSRSIKDKITTCFACDMENANKTRGIFESNFDADTLLWYTGFCVATTAGCIAASAGWFWVRIAGIVAAAAGAASMTTQIIIWATNSDLLKLSSAVTKRDTKTINVILNSLVGNALGIIYTETATTVVICSMTLFGKGLMIKVTEFMTCLASLLF